MLGGGVCIVFVVKPPAEPVLTFLMIGMDVEYGHAGRREHVGEGNGKGARGQRLVPFL
jgi:hypothetical protein